MKQLIRYFKSKKRKKYPKVEQVPFYKEDGNWYAELSYCNEKLSNMIMGKAVLLDSLATLSLSGRFGNPDYVALFFAINEDWPAGHYFRLDLINDGINAPYYEASGPMIEALEISDHQLPFGAAAKELFQDYPAVLYVYDLMLKGCHQGMASPENLVIFIT